MAQKNITSVLVCSLVFCISSLAMADEPLIYETIARMNGVLDEDVVLFNLPSGNGSDFSQALVKDLGTVIDATITMIVKDPFGVPVPDFPAEDTWLQSGDGGMVPCVGGNIADADTDEFGFTCWANPMSAGGASEDYCYVMINGYSLNGTPFALSFNSADLNGDGTVNLADVGLFSGGYFGDYLFGLDFFADGVLNLIDVGRLATGLGGSCP